MKKGRKEKDPKWIGSWSGAPTVLQPQNLIDEKKRKDWEKKVKEFPRASVRRPPEAPSPVLDSTPIIFEEKDKSNKHPVRSSLDPVSLKRFILMKELDFDAGHRLVDYKGKCGHNHGHYYKVEIYLYGDKLDNLGILEDFGTIKDKVQAWVDENWDHAMLLSSRDVKNVKFHKDQKWKHFIFPDGENPTAENISKFLYYKTKEITGFNVLQVTVFESPKSAATFTEQQVLKGLIEI